MGRPKIRDAEYKKIQKSRAAKRHYKKHTEINKNRTREFKIKNPEKYKQTIERHKAKVNSTPELLVIKRLKNVYNGIKRRCYNPKDARYESYGGRGIIMFSLWIEDRQAFLAWSIENGYKFDFKIDRIDNNGNYTPDNCRWSNDIEQANNKRNNVFLEYKGEVKSLSQWSKQYNILTSTLFARYKSGKRPPELFYNTLRFIKNTHLNK